MRCDRTSFLPTYFGHDCTVSIGAFDISGATLKDLWMQLKINSKKSWFSAQKGLTTDATKTQNEFVRLKKASRDAVKNISTSDENGSASSCSPAATRSANEISGRGGSALVIIAVAAASTILRVHDGPARALRRIARDTAKCRDVGNSLSA